MSTSRTPDGTAVSHTVRASHANHAFEPTIRLCRETLHANPLDYLAHYSDGLFDFSVDRLVPGEGGPGREDLQRVGQQLALRLTTVDRKLQEVRTGALIRTVLHTPSGAFFCDSVIPGQQVVGVIRDRSASRIVRNPSDQEDVLAADQAVALLVTAVRGRISLPSLNPGGWDVPQSPEPAVTGEAIASVQQLGRLDERAVELFNEALAIEELHMVAHCRDGEATLIADLFGESVLAPFFLQSSVAHRRRFYRSFCSELQTTVSTLNRMVKTVLGDLLVRVVLDVEQGAIYYYRLGARDYLVGVTLNQETQSRADERMARLALQFAQLDG
ncbi:hypothetical protein [Amycolatopsis sp. NPDC051128]|uniref:hypothetical protein n=1 Tax=Amycolatopsis sp. NPDC051128 TaxID=3155412 RepID=UPI003427C5B8